MRSNLLRRRLLCALGVVATAWLVCWILQAESSPVREYLLQHPAAENAWMSVNIPAAILGLAVSGNVHQPSFTGYLFGVAIQWGAMGFLASLALVRRRRASAR